MTREQSSPPIAEKPVLSQENPQEKKTHIAFELKSALLVEFPELDRFDKVDLRFLWMSKSGVSRYRVNGWGIVDGEYIVFSRFVRVWEEDGLKYEIVT